MGASTRVMSLNAAERTQLLKTVTGEAGVKARAEGDGHWKRVTVTPEKAMPMPRKMQFPDDEEDDDGDE